MPITDTQIRQIIGAQIIDNNERLITPSRVRSALNSMVDYINDAVGANASADTLAAVVARGADANAEIAVTALAVKKGSFLGRVLAENITANRNYQMPDASGTLLIGSITYDNPSWLNSLALAKVTGLQAALDGKAALSHTHAISDVTNLQSSLDGKADLVGGKVPQSQLPNITIGETFTVASQAAMLALTAQNGDVAIRTDLSNRKFLLTGGDASVLANWVEIGGSGNVASVNGYTGVVTLSFTDVGAAAASHGHAIADVTGLQAALDGKAAASHTHLAADITNFGGSVRALLLTGYAVGANEALAATDTILAAFGKIQAQLDGKQAAGSYAAASHSHAISDVTGLQTALDAKQASLPSQSGQAGKYLTTDGTNLSWAEVAGGGGGAWGSITGTLADQTDLQNALNAKANLSGAAFTGTVNAPTFANSLRAITTGATSGWFRIGNFSASNRGGGVFIISFTGNNHEPASYIIEVHKNWATGVTIFTRRHGGSTQSVISEVRVTDDGGTFYVEINYSHTHNLAANLYFNSLIGYNDAITPATGALAAGGGTVLASRPVASTGAMAADRFEATGYMSVAASNPYYRLSATGSQTYDMEARSSNGRWRLRDVTRDVERLTILTNDNAGVNNPAPAYAWDVTGDVNASGEVRVGGFPLRRVDQNVQTASYTLVLTDAYKIIRMNVASANTLTVPNNTDVAFPAGTQILVSQAGAGQTTITPGSGVTLNAADNALKTRVQHSPATLIKTATNTWLVSGDLTV